MKTYPAIREGMQPPEKPAYVVVHSNPEGGKPGVGWLIHRPRDGAVEKLPVWVHKIFRKKGARHRFASVSSRAESPAMAGSHARVGAHGGREMAHKNAVEIAEYATAIAQRLQQPDGDIPAWMEHKLSVARAYIGDIKHACDYRSKYGKDMPEPRGAVAIGAGNMKARAVIERFAKGKEPRILFAVSREDAERQIRAMGGKSRVKAQCENAGDVGIPGMEMYCCWVGDVEEDQIPVCVYIPRAAGPRRMKSGRLGRPSRGVTVGRSVAAAFKRHKIRVGRCH